jgi:excisionase family DNA binding protein
VERSSIQSHCLGRRDASVYLGVSTRMLDKLAGKNELPRIKIGSKTLFRVIDLEQFLLTKLSNSRFETKPIHVEAGQNESGRSSTRS